MNGVNRMFFVREIFFDRYDFSFLFIFAFPLLSSLLVPLSFNLVCFQTSS